MENRMASWFIVADAFLQLVPSTILLVLVFRKYFKHPMSVIWKIAVGFVMVSSVLPAISMSFSPAIHQDFTIYTTIYLFLVVLLCIYMIHFSPYQILLVLFFLENSVDCLFLLKECIFPYAEMVFPTCEYEILSIGLRIILTTLTLPFMIWFTLSLLRPIIEQDKAQPFHKYLWMIPACFYALLHLVIVPDRIRVSAQTFVTAKLPLVIIWTFCTFLIYTLILRMLQDTMEQAELEKKLEVSRLNASVQKKQYESLLDKIQETRTNRHDIRHHMLALKSYCNVKEYEQVEAYINQYMDTSNLDQSLIFCENVMINGMMQYYYELLAEHQIDSEINLQIPKNTIFKDEDICVIFGNAIENAYEACMRQMKTPKWMQIKACMFGKDSFTMQVKNSFEGEVKIAKNGNLISSKRNEEGIGVDSMKRICEKYNGTCQYHYENRVFTLSIQLNHP